MSDALKVVPSSETVKTGVTDVKAIAAGLCDVLADTYRLTFKTHAYHWNVTGPLFYSVHNLTEDQYEDMFAAADDLAERVRALGELAPMRMADIMERSRIEDAKDALSTGAMVDDLSRDHERLAHRLHGLIEIAGEHNDPVTEDLATARAAVHEKAVWMLRAITAD